MTKQGEAKYPLLFDDKEHFYAEPFGKASDLREFVDIQVMLLHKKGRLLELGAGSGGFSYLFAKCGFEVTGMDISPHMSEIAKNRFAKDGSVKINFITGDMEDISFDKEFEAIVIHDALHHCPNYRLVIANAFKSLKNGGELILAEPSLLHLISPHARKAVKDYTVTELGFSRFQLRRILKKTGFKAVRNFYPGIESYGPNPLIFLANLLKVIFNRFAFFPGEKILIRAVK